MLYVIQNILLLVTFPLKSVANISTTFSVNTCKTRPFVERWEKEFYPNPQNDTQEDFCGRRCKPSWICDPGHVIAMEEADALEDKIKKTRTLGFCGCSTCRHGIDGFSISIALLPYIDTDLWIDREASEFYADEFVNYLRNTTWQFGTCDNDVVILLSAKQKLVTIAAGKIVHSVVNDLMDIQNEANNKLLSEDTAYGVLYQMVTRLGQSFQNDTQNRQEAEYSPSISPDETMFIIVGAIVLLILLILISAYLKRKGFCRQMVTYRIELPTMTLHILKPLKDDKLNNHLEFDNEKTHIKSAENKEAEDIHIM